MREDRGPRGETVAQQMPCSAPQLSREEFYDWDDIRAELHDGDDKALAAERARTEAWVSAFHLAKEAIGWCAPTQSVVSGFRR
jgi:hypothetical protein